MESGDRDGAFFLLIKYSKKMHLTVGNLSRDMTEMSKLIIRLSNRSAFRVKMKNCKCLELHV